MVEITPTTAATPAAIAAKLAGNGKLLPLAVALARASPVLAPVLAIEAVVSASVDAILAALAALYIELAVCIALLILVILFTSVVMLSITPKIALPIDSITSKASISSKPSLKSFTVLVRLVAAPQLSLKPLYISLLASLIASFCSLLIMSGDLLSVSI